MLTPSHTDISKVLTSHLQLEELCEGSVLLSKMCGTRVANSWFTIKKLTFNTNSLPDVTWQNLLFDRHKFTTDRPLVRCKRIQLKPTTAQKHILRQWMGAYRFAYNFTVDRCKLNEFSYLKYFKQWTALIREQNPWILDIPAHIIYGAMRDATKDYLIVLRKRKQKIQASIPQCRKRTQKSFFVLGNNISTNGIFPQFLGKLTSYEPLPNKPKDGRIVCECNKWYLLTPYNTQQQTTENQGYAVAIDPGVRTFVTGFSQNEVFKIGEGAFNRIATLAKHADNLNSRLSKQPSARKKRMRLALRRMFVRIRHLVDDLHYQTIAHLTSKYSTIICPTGNFTNAVKKQNRKIRSKTVRALMTFCFARFRDRLRAKCQLLGVTFVEVNEAYTSKTHSLTGEIINNLGGRKTITSNEIRIDRDVNAAINIYVRGLLDQPLKSA